MFRLKTMGVLHARIKIHRQTDSVGWMVDKCLFGLQIDFLSGKQTGLTNRIQCNMTAIHKRDFYFSDGDEPLLSGSGVVSKEVTDENLLEAWHEVLVKWHQNLSQRPKQVQQLAKKGIPEALRGEVWQLLAGCHDNSELMEAYRILITKVRENNKK